MVGAARHGLQRRVRPLVRLAHERAARVERAARRPVDQRRRAALDRHELLAARRVEPRDRAQQAPRVGVLRRREELLRRRELDHPAGVHHRDLVRDLGDDAEVVRDHDHGGPGLGLQALDQLQDLRLHRHVERGRGLVGDQQLRLVDQRHGDHRALAHAARELVRVGVHARARLRDADELQHLDGLVARRLLGDVVVRAHRLHELRPDAVERVQRGERVLEDHRDLLAAHLAQLVLGQREQVAALEDHLAAERGVRGAGQAQHGEVRDALAGAGLAHDAERAAGVDRVGDAVDGAHDAVVRQELDREVADFEQRHG